MNYDKHNRQTCIGVTAPAFMVYKNDILIDKGFHILHNSTSQQGELYAVLLGVMNSWKYTKFGDHIRLFSDSLNTIFAIRDRIFNWVRMTNEGKNVLGDGGKINNQDYIMDIVYYIMYNQIPIEFFHVKGHVNIHNKESFDHACRVFSSSNYSLCEWPDFKLIKTVSEYNNAVDKYSTNMLRNYAFAKQFDTRGFINALTIGYTPIDMREYLYLVNGDKL